MSVYLFVCLYCMNMCLCVSVCVCACNVHHVAHCVRGSPLCYDSPWGEHDLCLRLSEHFAKQDDYLSGNMKRNILAKQHSEHFRGMEAVNKSSKGEVIF